MRLRPHTAPRRLLPQATLLCIGSALLWMYALRSGYYPVHWGDLARVLFGARPADASAPFVLLRLRLPRVLTAWLVGVCLGASGCIAQAVTRNAIAEPGVLGINAGASLAALLAFVLLGPRSTAWLPLAALCGASLATALVLLLGHRRSRSPTYLLLIGIAVATALSAAILTVINFGDIFAVEQALRWMLGSVAGVSWAQAGPLGVAVVVLVPATMLSGRTLGVHARGDDMARGLGARVGPERIGLFVLMAALAAASVAAAGPTAFVGMLAPNGARRMAAHPGAWQLLLSALLGGLLVLAGDTAGRLLFAPRELPCGLVTAMLGAPCLLLLMRRGRRRSLPR